MNQGRQGLLIIILLVFTSVMTVSAKINVAENQPHSKVVYAFWPYWTDPSSYQPDWNVLTHVAYHSWEANKDGMLKVPGDINRYNAVKNVLHQKGVKMIISIKSFDDDTIDSIFAYHKDDLANNILDALQTFGADGVNLDFEHPRIINSYAGVSNAGLFEDLMKTVYTKVKSKNPDYFISINVAGSVEEVYRNAALSKYIDAVFLRGYNYHSLDSSTTGAPSPYNDVINSVKLVENYYPPNEIILGLYFSGYDWPSSSNEPGSSTTGNGLAITMQNATANAKIYGRLWDSNSQTPWYKYKTGGAWHQTWYDDDQSLGLKLDYVNSENLGGAGFWALGYEGNNANVWKMVREKLVIEPVVTGNRSVTSTEYPKITNVNPDIKTVNTNIATVKPIETPKVPGFEIMVSLSGLLAWAFIAMRRYKNEKH